MKDNYDTIRKFLSMHGDSLYLRMKNLKLINFETDEQIDRFFYEIELFIDSIAKSFPVDLFFKDNSHMIDYYRFHDKLSKSQIKKTTIQIDKRIKDFLYSKRTPSLDYLINFVKGIPSSKDIVIQTQVMPKWENYIHKVRRGPKRELENANVEIFEKNIDLSLNEAFLKSVEEIGQTNLATNEYNEFFNMKLLKLEK